MGRPLCLGREPAPGSPTHTWRPTVGHQPFPAVRKQPLPAVCEVAWVDPSALAENPHPVPSDTHMAPYSPTAGRQPFPAVCEVPGSAPLNPHPTPSDTHMVPCKSGTTHSQPRGRSLGRPLCLGRDPNALRHPTHILQPSNHPPPCVRSLGSAPLPWQRTRTRLPPTHKWRPTAGHQPFPAVCEVPGSALCLGSEPAPNALRHTPWCPTW